MCCGGNGSDSDSQPETEEPPQELYRKVDKDDENEGEELDNLS